MVETKTTSIVLDTPSTINLQGSDTSQCYFAELFRNFVLESFI